MAEAISVHTPLVEFRQQEGGRFAGFITTPWFRYLVNSNPQGNGTGTGVLHGNASGAPTWGPVDLTADVTGQLPVANGGLGGLTRVIGGLPFFPTATTMASSSALAANHIVFGGGAAGPSTPLDQGDSSVVLHGNAGGMPFWSKVVLSTDVTAVLPVANGGTGSPFRTGTGLPVFDTGASMSNTVLTGPTLIGGTWSSAQISGALFWSTGTVPTSPQITGNDSAVTTVVVGPTVILHVDGPMLWFVYDKTVGGMAMGVMSSAGSHDIYNNISGSTFARNAGNGLEVALGVAPTTRTLSAFAILTGAP